MKPSIDKATPEKIRILRDGNSVRTSWYYLDAAVSKHDGEVFYVRQDIADERVRVAWDAAIRMAIQIVMERGEVLHRGNLIIALEAARNAAEGE